MGVGMKQARTLTEKQLKMVLAHCATRRHAARDRAIIAVSHLAGLRAKEIAALTLTNVCDDEAAVRRAKRWLDMEAAARVYALSA